MTWGAIEGKNKHELAAMVGSAAEPDSRRHHEMLATLQAKCSEDIEVALNKLRESQEKAASSSDKLAKRVFWLNVVLAFATLVGAVAAIIQAIALFRK